eukprot:GDKJ01021278.1.p1 GENE.GDKJ01021278.1~~GDKJ01021278.1.p1  ORF type:complete len:470 (+),score=121.77 GDKJ01021278.1:24-1433(+)
MDLFFSTEQRDKLNKFIDITKLDADSAQRFLTDCEWEPEIALNVFYQQQNAHKREIPKKRSHFLLRSQNPILVTCPILIITIGGTKDLPRFGNYNVAVEVDSQRFETPIIRDTGTPVFNQQFACTTFVGAPYVKITLQYEKIFKTSKAYAHLSLSQLEPTDPLPLVFPACTHKRYSAWLQLLRYNNNDGRIFVEVDVFSPTGEDPKEALRKAKGMIDAKGNLREGVIIAPPSRSPNKIVAQQQRVRNAVTHLTEENEENDSRKPKSNSHDHEESHHQTNRSNTSDTSNKVDNNKASAKSKPAVMIDFLSLDDDETPSAVAIEQEQLAKALNVPPPQNKSPAASDSSTRLRAKETPSEQTVAEKSSTPQNDPFSAFDSLVTPPPPSIPTLRETDQTPTHTISSFAGDRQNTAGDIFQKTLPPAPVVPTPINQGASVISVEPADSFKNPFESAKSSKSNALDIDFNPFANM